MNERKIVFYVAIFLFEIELALTAKLKMYKY